MRLTNLTQENTPDIPTEIYDFLGTLNPDDVGMDHVAGHRVYYEGFTDWCQQDAQQRCQLPKDDPRHLSSYDDIYDEVLHDFIAREDGRKPIASGLTGDPDHPIMYAVFSPMMREATELVRLDPKRIRDFTQALKTYHHNKDWSVSGIYDDPTAIPTDMSSAKGLFAADKHDSAPYAAPRGIRFITFADPFTQQPVVVFSSADRDRIRSHRPVLSTFDASRFRNINGSEWFSDDPGEPTHQTVISNPLRYMQQNGWKVAFTDDLDDFRSRLQAAGRQHGAEGFDESLEENLRDWFKQKWVRFGPDGKIRGSCARGSDSEGKPKCLPQKKAHALGKKGRASAARRKRREDPNPERHGKAKNVRTRESIDESAMTCPHCGGMSYGDQTLAEKRDACYYKVKSRYKVWPSAYASGALVQCRKKGAKNWGKNHAEESMVLEREARDKITNAVIDFYRKHTKLTPPDDYEAAAQELIKAAEPDLRDKIIHILKQAKGNPYLQGGFITTIGALLAGKVIGLSAQYGLSPYQTNLMLQAILNTVIPALVSKINGRDWKETVKYTLASAGVGTGIAALGGMNENQDDAVHDLMSDLGKKRKSLAADSIDDRYENINDIMQHIAKRNGMTATQLHKAWIERYGELPDEWVLDENYADSRDIVPAQQILDYVKDIHPAGEFNIDHVITDYPHWTHATVPIGKLHIFDPEADEVEDPYNRVQDTDLYHVRKLIPNIASIVQKRPIVIDDHGWVLDGNHRALAALKAGLTSIPAWMPAKGPIDENFADGKGPGRPGDSQRHGIPKKATMAQLQKAAKAPGRKGQLARWQINMRRGRKRAHESMDESLHKAHISFPDGDIYVSSHVWQRRQERDMDMATIAGLVFDAIRQHGEAISRLGAENFVVRDDAGNGIGIAKVLQPDDTYKYIIQTTHPNMRIGRDQTFFRIDEEEMTVDQWRELRKVDPKTYDGTKDWQTMKWWEGMYRMHEKKAREQGAKHFEFPPGSNMWFTVTKGSLWEINDEQFSEGDIIANRFAIKQAQKGQTPYVFNQQIADRIPLYDPNTYKMVPRNAAKGGEKEFTSFTVRELSSRVGEIVGITDDGRKIGVGVTHLDVAHALADAYSRGGFTDKAIQRVPLGELRLDERATDTLFHYTGIANALAIVQSGEFKLSNTHGSVETKYAPRGKPYFLSTTRSKAGGYHRYVGNSGVMFDLDGRWINDHYVTKPIDYWSGMGSTERHRESEDRIFSADPTMPITPVTSMHVLLVDKDEFQSPRTRKLLIAAKRSGIPTHLYRDEKSWRLQNTAKAVSIAAARDQLKGIEPSRHRSSGRRWLKPWIELMHAKDRDSLGKDALKLLRDMEYWRRPGEDDYGLKNELGNARKPGNSGYEDAVKITKYMRDNGLEGIMAFVEHIKSKWLQSATMVEAVHGAALTVFDIDDTLFRTTAKISVVKDGEVIKRLDGTEYQNYQLGPGESYDYAEFKDAKRFNATSIPIDNMWHKAQDIMRGIGRRPGSRVIIVTARPDLDDKDLFLDTFSKHGLDIDKIHVHRAGNLPVPAAAAKKAIISTYLATDRYQLVRFFDDSKANLDAFLQLREDYPGIEFKAYLVLPSGDVAHYNP